MAAYGQRKPRSGLRMPRARSVEKSWNRSRRLASLPRSRIVACVRLWHRLFLAFAALSALALVGFASLQLASFRRGFLAYLDQVAIEQLQPATGRLAAAYRENAGWEFLRGDPGRFARLVDPRGEREPPRGPPPDEAMPHDRGPPPPPPRLRGIALHDAEGRRVEGDPNLDEGAHRIPIELDGERIGSLWLQPLPRVSNELDLGFERAQARNVWYAGLAMLVVAFLFAFALARWLLAPVRALTEGTHALAAGDYSRRVEVSRSDELGTLAADFNRLATALDDHREARRRWGADIAHELRTPLSVLRGEVQALQDGIRVPDARALASLDAECERLGRLIDDLYQLSLADAGALDYRHEDVDLAALVCEAVDLQRAAGADLGLAIEEAVESVPTLRADPRRLAQLVDNLLANARRYTDPPGRIRVALSRDGDALCLVVEDSAPGVAAHDLPHLFERLYRVERSRSRREGGAGLGLSICRAIVEAHGGTMDAAPSPLGGLRIAVRLPFAGRSEA